MAKSEADIYESCVFLSTLGVLSVEQWLGAICHKGTVSLCRIPTGGRGRGEESLLERTVIAAASRCVSAAGSPLLVMTGY